MRNRSHSRATMRSCRTSAWSTTTSKRAFARPTPPPRRGTVEGHRGRGSRGRRRLSARGYAHPMGTPAIPSLSTSQLATLAAAGEERRAGVGDVLYRVGDAAYPFIAIREGEGAVLGAAGHENVR